LESGVTIDYQQKPVEQLAAEQPAHYDIVTCLEMLEHVPSPASIIRACADLAKPGANLFFSTINRNPKAYAFAIVGAEYLLKLLPKGTHEYGKFIRPAELASWIRSAGLILENTTGMTYNPLIKKYSLSSNDISVNYIVHARKPS
jgi:2-polyprenyl-6-hydroxyphenyl methylase/3-demethylubiquinone-9 3-methyltransferase